MKIINYLKKLFIKQQSGFLTKISDSYQTPTREYYKNDLNALNIIDNYKNVYLNILRSKRLVSSKELSLDSIQETMKINTDLIIHLLMNNENFIEFTSEELEIQYAKIDLYLKEIKRLETETALRLVALKELYKDRKVPRYNKIHIESEIESLTINLISYQVQKEAIERSKEAYKNNIIINKNDDNNLIENRHKRLITLAESIIDTSLFQTPSIVNISILERELEIYAYTHKNDIKTLDEDLQELDKVEKTKYNKEQLLNKIKLIEQKYLIFYDYGRNLVDEDKLAYLYKIKFDILTCDICTVKESPINKDDEGYLYYIEIVFQKIQEIFNQNNKIIQFNFGSDKEQALQIIQEYFKNNGEYQYDVILNDKFRLGLLLAFESLNGLRNMFENTQLRTDIPKNEMNIYEENLIAWHGIFWEQSVPLISAFNFGTKPSDDEIVNINRAFYKSLGISSTEIEETFLFKLYKLLISKNESKDIFKFPEGIVKIDFNNFNSFSKKKLREQTNRKVIIFPSSLRSINGNLFINNGISKIVLNEGLEYLGAGSLKFDGNTVAIPSSVKYISSNAFDTGNLKNIVFENSENSKLLQNEEAMKEFIKPFIKKSPTGNIKFHPESSYLQEQYYRFLYMGIDISSSFNPDDYDSEWHVYLNLDSICFELDSNNSPFVINQNNIHELSFTYYMLESHFHTFHGKKNDYFHFTNNGYFHFTNEDVNQMVSLIYKMLLKNINISISETRKKEKEDTNSQ